MITSHSTDQLIAYLRDARLRTLELIDGLTDEQLMGPRLATTNPLRWEIGHVAYFHEFWNLRHLGGREPILDNADALYDSININHDDRWDLPLLPLPVTLAYLEQVLDAQIARLQRPDVSAQDLYLSRYAVFHEDMHTEAFTYTRQTLAYPTPGFALALDDDPLWHAGPLPGDVEIPGGTFILGADPETDFCFDNEKWGHPVEIGSFRIARAAVTNAEFAEFVDAGGYSDPSWWDDESWQWRTNTDLQHPVYWRRNTDGAWQARQFDQLLPLRPHAAVIHISWYEAQAWCRWANRRLPTEAEWELAAAGEPAPGRSGFGEHKRMFPWGDEAPSPRQVNMDGRAMGAIDVGALPDGDSAFGCRQMLGNVWEWTADTFGPFPGFSPDMYQDYSQPLFDTTRVLRGGAWCTRSRMLRNTWRNYYGPDRNDVYAGFRTCAT